MATNDFQPFAYGGAANVVSQSAYLALTTILQNGFSSGVAQSAQLNKVWRQSSIMAAVLAQFSSDYSGQNSIDDGTTATLETNLIAAIRSVTKTGVILADTGAANAYTAVNVPPLVAGTWIDGVVQQVKIAHANTGASTYAPDGLTAIPIYGLGLQPLQGGELALNGTAVLMHATIAGVNGGNPICVLMECAGGAQQIAPATQSQHAVQLGQIPPMMRNYIAGLTLANNGTNPNTQVDFAPGVAVDNANAFIMSLAATMTKTLQASGAFAAGTGNNGLFSGAKAVSTWYHCFLIRNTATGAIDAGFDTSVTAANIPAGYSAYRRVGSILTDASGNIRTFVQFGNEFDWVTPLRDINVTGIGIGTANYAVTVPPGIQVEAVIQGFASSTAGSSAVNINTPGLNDVASGNAPTTQTPGTNAGSVGRLYVRTNTAQQIQIATTQTGTQYSFGAYGWRDLRGSNN